MREKGSIISRIKDWFRIQKQKKLKRKREINHLKKKRHQMEQHKKEQLLQTSQIRTYSKLEIIGKVSIGLFLGFFEAIITPKKKEVYLVGTTELEAHQMEIRALETEIRTLRKKIEKEEDLLLLNQQLIDKKQQVKQLEQKTNQFELKLEPSLERKQQEETLMIFNQELVTKVIHEIEKLEQKIQEKQEQEEKKDQPMHQETKKEALSSSPKKEKVVEPPKKKNQKNPTIKEILKGIVLTPFVVATNKKNPERNTTLLELHEEKQEKKRKEAEYLVRKKEVREYLGTSKKKIKELKDDLQEYKEWAARTHETNSKKEYAVHVLIDRINELLKEYRGLEKDGFFLEMEHDDDLKKVDPYHLLTNEKELLSLLTLCEQEIQKLTIKRELEQEVPIEEPVEKKEEHKKEEKKPQKIIKGFTDLEDINLLNEVIDDNLKRQELEIDKIKELFKQAEMMKKRGTFLGGIHRFLSNTITVGLSLLPLKIFKNRMVGVMGSSIVLNNRLRSMRKLINKQNNDIEFITYKNVAQQIHEEKACTFATQAILDDTMQQLGYLKTEFFLEFSYDMDRYPESALIQEQFRVIEEQILRRNMELQEMLGQLNRLEEKSNQKVLKLEKKEKKKVA